MQLSWKKRCYGVPPTYQEIEEEAEAAKARYPEANFLGNSDLDTANPHKVFIVKEGRSAHAWAWKKVERKMQRVAAVMMLPQELSAACDGAIFRAEVRIQKDTNYKVAQILSVSLLLTK